MRMECCFSVDECVCGEEGGYTDKLGFHLFEVLPMLCKPKAY